MHKVARSGKATFEKNPVGFGRVLQEQQEQRPCAGKGMAGSRAPVGWM